ncbi:MAG: anti-sigma factor [Chthoniobacterales bacterium]|nr:anti-sigma factor [Chthoniobacterales bacterium]
MDDFSELEAELKQLRPRQMSPELATRIETALARELAATPTAGVLPQARKFQVNWFALGAGITAAAAFILLARANVDRAPHPQQAAVASNTASPRASVTGPTPGGFVPDGLTRVVYHTRDEGRVFPRTASGPSRRVRSRARETLQWREPITGASLRVCYPTDEVELIPISSQ